MYGELASLAGLRHTEMRRSMLETCTCGAQLPADALFCHKCGKPQREITPEEPEILAAPQPIPTAMPAPSLEARAEAAPVNFRNPDALKVALLSAVLSTFLFFLPYVNWVAAGYFAVFFYRRRTRRTVNIAAGVRIGWLTGLMSFAIIAVLTISVLLMLRVPGVLDQMKALAQNSTWFEQSLKVMQDKSMMATSLAGGFVLATFCCMTGGLLGAVLTGAVNRPPRGGNTA